MNQKKHVAIVLAAGKGLRMKTDIPKQFLSINGKPLICHCLETFQNSFIDEIILVTSQAWLSYCEDDIVKKHGYTKVSQVVCGGENRYDSVYKGICAARDADYFYIHDGARPAVTVDMLVRGKQCVEQYDIAIAGVPTKDTIKVVDDAQNVTETPDRSHLWNVQTPQIFKADLIRQAYETMYAKELYHQIAITDDAMLVEATSNIPVKMFEGAYTNLKVTTAEDVFLAEMILKNGN